MLSLARPFLALHLAAGISVNSDLRWKHAANPTKDSCQRPPSFTQDLGTADALLVPLASSDTDRDLVHWRGKVYSQLWADGIIWKIFRDIGTTNNFFVEFGTQDGSECNTRFLRERCGWTGLLMDGDNDNALISLHSEWITRDNIVHLFEKYNVPRNPDLLSVDIDGNDFHVLEAILEEGGFRPRVIVVEAAMTLPPDVDMVIRYKPDHQWDGTCYSSASMLSYQKLGRRFGYSVVAALTPDVYLVHDPELLKLESPYTNTGNITALYDLNQKMPFAELAFAGSVPASAVEPMPSERLEEHKRECMDSFVSHGFVTADDSHGDSTVGGN